MLSDGSKCLLVQQRCRSQASARLILRCITIVLLLFFGRSLWACGDKLSLKQIDTIGKQIFLNECNGQPQCLVHWNEGEVFPSLGIGHYIWYPKGVDAGFVESFPLLIEFMKNEGVEIPDWLKGIEPFDAPWLTREEYLRVSDGPLATKLRAFLRTQIAVQVAFMQRRMLFSLDAVVDSVDDSQKAPIRSVLNTLCATKAGVYALVDYVNFKGDGLSSGETYKGQGWGLRQVLVDMVNNPYKGRASVAGFSRSAERVLTDRANNADSPLEKRQWLPIWKKRLDTYRHF